MDAMKPGIAKTAAKMVKASHVGGSPKKSPRATIRKPNNIDFETPNAANQPNRQTAQSQTGQYGIDRRDLQMRMLETAIYGKAITKMSKTFPLQTLLRKTSGRENRSS
jgi:hypothetical protein